jgi:hypothetical protein
VSTQPPVHLNNAHRDTLLKIFQHPTSHNIEWREVTSLLAAVGSVEQTHGGKVRIVVGDETEVVERPRDKDVDVQLVLDLRRLLTGAGYEGVVAEEQARGTED